MTHHQRELYATLDGYRRRVAAFRSFKSREVRALLLEVEAELYAQQEELERSPAPAAEPGQ